MTTQVAALPRRAVGLRERALVYAKADTLALVAIAVGLITRLLHWQITERKFEDGLITVTHAVNAVNGVGLTHHPGEAVTHGFTTALSVLVPLVGEALGFLPLMDGFLMLRLVSLVAFVLTIVAADRLCRKLAIATWPRAFVLLFLAIDFNQIFYAMAGMETQMAVAILLWAVVLTMERRAVPAGVLYGLCILVRPDFVLFVVPGLISFGLAARRDAVRAALCAGALVAPWVIFTTIYYGSPIPNTIKAKALRYHVDYPQSINPVDWWHFVADQVYARDSWWHTFTPFLENGLVQDAPILPFFSAAIAVTLIGLGVVGMSVTRNVPGWRVALVFMGLFVGYRLLTLPPTYYEWYYPPFTALLVICAAKGLTHLSRLGLWTTNLVAGALAALFAWPTPAFITLESRVQHEIENKVRMPLGVWLRNNVRDDQSVTSESAGYVGFYGRRKLYDYPGLTSKYALERMQKLGWQHNTMLEEVNAIRPDFVVWRPNELEAFTQSFPQTARLYAPVARFSVDPAKTPLTWGGVTYINIDRDFIVVKRRGA